MRFLGDQMEFRLETSRVTYDGLRITGPRFQADNAACAIAVCEEALGRPLEPGALADALSRVEFPGRFELVRRDPLTVLDGAHNLEGVQALVSAIGDLAGDDRFTVVLGMLSDKPVMARSAALT